jgi:hypothetical protein
MSTTLRGGTIRITADNTYDFGQLDLDGEKSTLAFAAPAAVVRFKGSANVAWELEATFVITNWAGSVTGGGAHQVFVGSTATGLSPSQTRQVLFVNPAGHDSGIYPARLLSSGELVPAERIVVSVGRTAGAVTLSWTGSHELWTATNMAGPYTPLSGASSPYTNSIAEPQRYFQLRSRTP